jgi:hypothetical protein
MIFGCTFVQISQVNESDIPFPCCEKTMLVLKKGSNPVMLFFSL